MQEDSNSDLSDFEDLFANARQTAVRKQAKVTTAIIEEAEAIVHAYMPFALSPGYQRHMQL